MRTEFWPLLLVVFRINRIWRLVLSATGDDCAVKPPPSNKAEHSHKPGAPGRQRFIVTYSNGCPPWGQATSRRAATRRGAGDKVVAQASSLRPCHQLRGGWLRVLT